MQEFMTYEEYLRDVKKGIITDLGNCPVTPLLTLDKPKEHGVYAVRGPRNMPDSLLHEIEAIQHE